MAVEKKPSNKIFAPLKGKELYSTPEERVRQEFIAHLVSNYGYKHEQMAQEVQVNNSKRGLGKARADIVIWKSAEDKKAKKKPAIVIECKAEQVSIHQEDYYQGFNYASWAGARFFVTTNLKDTKYFRVNQELLPDALDEIVEIPNAEELNNEKKVQELLEKTKAFTRDEFSKLLFKCHNIIRNNDKLSPEAAFDEISKILFMKIRFEREQAVKKLLFTKEQFEQLRDAYVITTGTKGKPFYQYFFDQTKEIFKDDEIFDPNDSIKIRENSFLQIVKELQKYNLSDTSDDIKGIAFEEFLGKTFRGELGQFFTPRTIVDYMVDILDPQEGEKICDPCCGSGGFLIKAFEYVREKIERSIQAEKEKIKNQFFNAEFEKLSPEKQEVIVQKVDTLFNQLNYELDLHNPKSRLRTLSYDCIFGTDANPRMARTAKMNMIMHGDGHGGVHHHDGLLNVNGIFDGRFDVILTNPPFGARVEKNLKVSPLDVPSEEKVLFYDTRYKEYNYRENVLEPLQQWAEEEKPILDIFDVGKFSGLTEVLFIERCLRLLKPGGRLGIVLPEGVLNNSALQKVRDYVEGKAKIINITSIPQDVFIASGANVKPSLVFLRKFTDEEAEEYSLIVESSRLEVEANHQEKLVAFEAELQNAQASKDKTRIKEVKKKYKDELKILTTKIEDEIKALVKEKFDYPIPVIEVEKAGISSTGAPCENELDDVVVEFRKYIADNKLWDNLSSKAIYKATGDKMTRAWIVDSVVGEDEVFYN